MRVSTFQKSVEEKDDHPKDENLETKKCMFQCEKFLSFVVIHDLSLKKLLQMIKMAFSDPEKNCKCFNLKMDFFRERSSDYWQPVQKKFSQILSKWSLKLVY